MTICNPNIIALKDVDFFIPAKSVSRLYRCRYKLNQFLSNAKDITFPNVQDENVNAIEFDAGHYPKFYRGDLKWDFGRYNCMNYALNTKVDKFLQPGFVAYKFRKDNDVNEDKSKNRGISYGPKEKYKTEILKWIDLDGLRQVEKLSDLSPGERLIALVIRPNAPDVNGNDFHWYRLDASGLWSHKPGADVVRNYDCSNNIILNPVKANTGAYEFQAYYAYHPKKFFKLG